MKESYDEGLATHIGPESCAGNGNIMIEALTGVSAGWVLSPERDLTPSADVFQVCRRQHPINRYGEGYEDSAGPETPGMHGNSLPLPYPAWMQPMGWDDKIKNALGM